MNNILFFQQEMKEDAQGRNNWGMYNTTVDPNSHHMNLLTDTQKRCNWRMYNRTVHQNPHHINLFTDTEVARVDIKQNTNFFFQEKCSFT